MAHSLRYTFLVGYLQLELVDHVEHLECVQYMQCISSALRTQKYLLLMGNLQ